MKKKLKLTKLMKNEERKIVGGCDVYVTHDCGCACWYAGEPGGSSCTNNGSANDAHGWHSPEKNPKI